MKASVPDELVSLNTVQYRQLPSGMNRIIYALRAQMIYIHGLCDLRKDFKALLMRRILEVK